MDTKIKKAIEGHVPTLNELYNNNKQKAYAFSFFLFDNKTTASKVIENVFTSAWKELKAKNIQTEEEFELLISQKTLFEAKKALYKENPKGLQIPKNQNFNVTSSSLNANTWKEAISPFSPLQKIIFLSRVIFSMSPEQIAKAINLDTTSVKLAINAEKSNIEKNTNELKIQDIESQILKSLGEINNNDISSDSEYVVLNSIKSFSNENSPRKNNGAQNDNSLIYILSAVIGVIVLIVAIILISGNNDTTENSLNPSTSTTSQATITDWKTSVVATDYAVIDIKDYGKISVALDENTAPITVSNFKKLANEGFYDGLTFHRIIKGFMMQGGDPKGNGTGDAGQDIKGEFSANGVKNNLSHVRGAISMARGETFDSASCQFFIVHEDSLYLNEKYAAFGYVVDGMDIVDKVCNDVTPTDDNGTIPSSEQPIINSVKIYSVEEFNSLSDNSSDVSADLSATESENESNDASVNPSDDTSSESDDKISKDNSSDFSSVDSDNVSVDNLTETSTEELETSSEETQSTAS